MADPIQLPSGRPCRKDHLLGFPTLMQWLACLVFWPRTNNDGNASKVPLAWPVTVTSPPLKCRCRAKGLVKLGSTVALVNPNLQRCASATASTRCSLDSAYHPPRRCTPGFHGLAPLSPWRGRGRGRGGQDEAGVGLGHPSCTSTWVTTVQNCSPPGGT